MGQEPWEEQEPWQEPSSSSAAQDGDLAAQDGDLAAQDEEKQEVLYEKVSAAWEELFQAKTTHQAAISAFCFLIC